MVVKVSSKSGRLFDSVLVRPPTYDLIRCVSTHPLRNTVDPSLALRQHGEYVKALRGEGIDVHVLPQLNGFPDAVFIQDTAVISSVQRKALISRFGVPSRRGEERSVEEFVSKAGFEISRVEPPATLEGGDVLVTDVGVIYVGVSTRTNPQGVEVLRHFFREHKVVAVSTEKVFHLLSAVNYIGSKTIAVVPELVDASYFEGFKLVRIPLDEAYAANMLYLGNGKVLLPAGHPKTVEKLRSEGLTPLEVEISEFRKCDGGVTCLSLPLYMI